MADAKVQCVNDIIRAKRRITLKLVEQAELSAKDYEGTAAFQTFYVSDEHG
jgi:hypothetical protein